VESRLFGGVFRFLVGFSMGEWGMLPGNQRVCIYIPVEPSHHLGTRLEIVEMIIDPEYEYFWYRWT